MRKISSISFFFVLFMIYSANSYAARVAIKPCLGESFTSLAGDVYFCGSTTKLGSALFKSNGERDGTTVVKNFDELGQPLESFFDLVIGTVNNLVLFTARDRNGHWGLWRTDGSKAGTIFIKALTFESGGRVRLINEQSKKKLKARFFVVSHENGLRVLWKSDGSVQGTRKVDEVNSAFFGLSGMQLDGKYYYTANDSELRQVAIVGSEKPRILKTFKAVSFRDAPFVLGSIGNKVAFIGLQDDFSDFDLWVSDGTVDGTRRLFGYDEVSIINTESNDRWLLCDLETGKYFITDGEVRVDLGITSSSSSFFCETTAAFVNQRWLIPTPEGINFSDGTAQGTVFYPRSVVPVVEFSSGDRPVFGTKILFADGVERIWETDGTNAGTSVLRSFDNSRRIRLISAQPLAYLIDQRFDSINLLRVDTESQVQLLKLSSLPGHNPSLEQRRIEALIAVGKQLYFSANNRVWYTDGTRKNTYRLRFDNGDNSYLPGINSLILDE